MHYQIDTLVEHNRYLAFFIAFYYITFNCPLNYLHFWHPPPTHTIFFFWLHWVFVAAVRHSLVAANRGYSLLGCVSFSLQRLLVAEQRSVVVVRGPGCSAACEICPNQGSNPCPLHWQANPYLLCHQGSPFPHFLTL